MGGGRWLLREGRRVSGEAKACVGVHVVDVGFPWLFRTGDGGGEGRGGREAASALGGGARVYIYIYIMIAGGGGGRGRGLTTERRKKPEKCVVGPSCCGRGAHAPTAVAVGHRIVLLLFYHTPLGSARPAPPIQTSSEVGCRLQLNSHLMSASSSTPLHASA